MEDRIKKNIGIKLRDYMRRHREKLAREKAEKEKMQNELVTE